MMTAMTRKPGAVASAATAMVADHVRRMILSGELQRGQKLPPEREMVQSLGLSRTSIRAGLQLLANKGILVIRHGTGTFVADGPLILDSEQFHFLSALHGFSRGDMFEARRSLESTVAGLAAERATGDNLAEISDAVTGMFVSLGDPLEFLRYDAAFHRAVAEASKNPIMASLAEMVSGMFFEVRKGTAHRGRDLQPIAEEHRLIYRAIRERDAAAASRYMVEHLLRAERLQQVELASGSVGSKSADAQAVARTAS
jgi:GntR family transcriptional repressor for pyruvate dehydrogenase complex